MQAHSIKFLVRPVIILTVSLIVTILPVLAADYVDWYPGNISPPQGTNYQCNLTPLPRSLPGIPTTDRQFINHMYSMILKAIQAKLLILQAISDNKNISAVYSRYYYDIIPIRKKIMDEPAPNGLNGFKENIVKALNYQLSFFSQAQRMRLAGKSMTEVFNIPDGHIASSCLMAAWQDMSKRYPSCGKDLKDSIYHHLCALDLF